MGLSSAKREDKRREIAALRRKQINSGKRQFISARCQFVVDLGEKMSGDALNAGFQFARSKVPHEKAWRNTYDQVQADWGTHKSLSMKWARLLLRRVRHGKLEVEKRRSQKSAKRVFMCSKRAAAADGVRDKGMASLWQPVVVNDMLGYVSTVPGIGFGTGLFVVLTKGMSGPRRFDPPGRYCQWQEPIECRRPPRFQKLHHAEVNGLAEAGGYGKFSQHRCRIAWHQQRSKWWRFRREFMWHIPLDGYAR